MPNRQYEEQASNGVEAEKTNVIDFAKAQEKRQEREPAASDEELAEYRRMLPILRMMIREREVLMGPTGCPVMRGILGEVD